MKQAPKLDYALLIVVFVVSWFVGRVVAMIRAVGLSLFVPRFVIVMGVWSNYRNKSQVHKRLFSNITYAHRHNRSRQGKSPRNGSIYLSSAGPTLSRPEKSPRDLSPI
jgi:hypothetical protein